MEEEVEFETIMYPEKGIKPIIIVEEGYSSEELKELKLTNFWYYKDDKRINYKREYIPQNGDRIFIDPQCNIPRFKLRAWGEPQNISIVRSIDKANIKVVCDNTTDSYLQSKYWAVMRISEFKLLPKNKKYDEVYKFIDAKLETGEITSKDYIGCDYHFELKIEDLVDRDEDNLFESVHLYFFDEERDGEKMIRELSDPNNPFYHENAILNIINDAHGTVMDEEMYNTIKSLFESSDENNHVVAMESMANCKYSESAIFLLKLIQQYKSQIYNNRVKNNVNFKSLLNFFNVNLYRSYDIEQMLDSLKHANLFTSENLSILYPEIMESVQLTGNFDYFEVDTIKLTDNGLKALQTSEPVKEDNDFTL